MIASCTEPHVRRPKVYADSHCQLEVKAAKLQHLGEDYPNNFIADFGR